MTSTIPNIVPSGNDEITSDRFLSVQFTILKTNLTLAEKVAYALILSWRDRECFYSHQSFAELLSCSERKAQDVLKSLAKKGLIEVTARNGTSNAYRALPWQNLLPPLTDTLAESATPPSRICHPPQQNLLPPLAESATYNNNYKINNKISNKNTVADAPIGPSLVVSHYPSEPKPKTKAKKKSFPDEGYWSEAFPNILEWMKSKGFNGSDDAAKTWFDQCVERMRDACEANPSKYRYDNWAAAFKNWNRDRLFKESSSDAWIVAVFQYFWNETRTPVEKPQVTDGQRAAVNQALKKLGDSWRGGLSEATEKDRPFRLKEFRDQVLQETK